jgi:hypothetical protein
MQIRDVEREQREKLIGLLLQNKNCDYGRRYDFGSINSIQEFQERVPLTTYEDYAEFIEGIREGRQHMLTSEDVLLLEPTSGSTSASKLIPYTRGLKEEFQKGLKPWIYDLYTGIEGIKWGKSYWSVTPATVQKEMTPGGIPIGFEEDSAYFGGLEKWLLDHVFAVPGHVAKAATMDEFFFQTSVHLLACQNLTLISIWNPTYLVLLLAYMHSHADKLTAYISNKDRQRGQSVAGMLAAKAYHRLWPSLKVISCWGDANAAGVAGQLQEQFPGVRIQPKGLLATEALISFPFVGETGARLSLRSHFFEFCSVKDGRLCLAHELRLGEHYEVIVTTSGGFYRYQLRDIITVTGFSGIFPLVAFQGKADQVSDLFGEKLNETFVKNAVERLGVNPGFYLVAPETDRYVLYIKTDHLPAQLDTRLDDLLQENFHYDYCRKLGQLKAVRVFRLTGNPEQEYLEACMKHGQRLGDIKPRALQLKGGWDHEFKGEYQ